MEIKVLQYLFEQKKKIHYSDGSVLDWEQYYTGVALEHFIQKFSASNPEFSDHLRYFQTEAENFLSLRLRIAIPEYNLYWAPTVGRVRENFIRKTFGVEIRWDEYQHQFVLEEGARYQDFTITRPFRVYIEIPYAIPEKEGVAGFGHRLGGPGN